MRKTVLEKKFAQKILNFFFARNDVIIIFNIVKHSQLEAGDDYLTFPRVLGAGTENLRPTGPYHAHTMTNLLTLRFERYYSQTAWRMFKIGKDPVSERAAFNNPCGLVTDRYIHRQVDRMIAKRPILQRLY